MGTLCVLWAMRNYSRNIWNFMEKNDKHMLVHLEIFLSTWHILKTIECLVAMILKKKNYFWVKNAFCIIKNFNWRSNSKNGMEIEEFYCNANVLEPKEENILFFERKSVSIVKKNIERKRVGWSESECVILVLSKHMIVLQ